MIDVFPALFDHHFIKVIFLVHATLVSIANITIKNSFDVAPYTSYNGIFLLALLLSILVDENVNIVLIATLFNLVCVLLDVFFLIGAWNPGVLATLVIVVNLLCRPLSSILLLKNYSARAGVEDPTGGLLEVNVANPAVPRARSAYHNIDEPNQTLP